MCMSVCVCVCQAERNRIEGDADSVAASLRQEKGALEELLAQSQVCSGV